MNLRFYVCPTPNCGNYYGSSGMPDLATSMTHGGESNERSRARDICPECGEARVLRSVLLPDPNQPVETA